VARVPININVHSKKWDHQQQQQQQQQPANTKSYPNEQHLSSASSENVDLSRMNGTEEDKIQAMMIQSTLDYDPLK
jgi:Tfp pilus assembly major pilin PilA